MTRSDRDLRIVLFGMPHAGKTSLLGAFAQAAQTQEPLLNGHVTDLSQGLGELQRCVYEEGPRETLDEIVPYRVAYDSVSAEPPENGHRVDAVFIDCDGRAAERLLAMRQAFEGGSNPQRALARAVIVADALILAIDASRPSSHLDADFKEFGRFLELLEHGRGRRSDVGGLPVFLVLTKCDLLARPTDSSASWIEQTEEMKRDVSTRFREFLTKTPLPFSAMDVHLWATAVKRPCLSDAPASPREPFGVAQLFRQALVGAGGFRKRQRLSGRRLRVTVAATLGILALLIGLTALILLNRREFLSTALAAKIAVYRSSEGPTASSRLREPLRSKVSELKDFKNDPDFRALAQGDRDFVDDRLRELQDYARFKDKLGRIQLAEIHQVAELDRSEELLTGPELALSVAYAREWAETEAVLRKTQLLADIKSLRTAATQAEDWYRRSVRQAEELRTFDRGKPSDAPTWADWMKRVNNLLASAFPHAETEELPGSGTLTYGKALDFGKAPLARKDWDSAQLRLGRLRDLTAALGMAGPLPGGDRQPLDFPDPCPMASVRSCLAKLEKTYPNLTKSGTRTEIPEAIALDLRRTARMSYDRLLEAGREAVLTRLQQTSPDGKETAESWRRLRDWLADPQELREWRVLANLLVRIHDENAADPVKALADFLRQEHFDIDPRQITLEVPWDRKLRPSGKYTIYFGSRGTEAAPASVFKMEDEDGRRDAQRRSIVYSFTRETGAGVSYRPGDTLYADLSVNKEGGDTPTITWDRGRSEIFQFERIVLPPRLHFKDQESAKEEVLQDVVVSVKPETGVPKVPDLVPLARSQKR